MYDYIKSESILGETQRYRQGLFLSQVSFNSISQRVYKHQFNAGKKRSWQGEADNEIRGDEAEKKKVGLKWYLAQ